MPPKQLSGTAVPFTLLTTADVPVKQEGAIGLCVLISLFPPVEPSAGATRQVSPTREALQTPHDTTNQRKPLPTVSPSVAGFIIYIRKWLTTQHTPLSLYVL